MSDPIDTQQLDTRTTRGETIQRGGLLGYRTLILGVVGCLAPLALLWLLLHYKPDAVDASVIWGVLGAIVTGGSGAAGFHSWVKVRQAGGAGGKP